MDPGETPVDTVVREIKEEIGLTLTPVQVGRPVAFDSGRWQHAGTTFVTVNWYFFARAATPDVDLSGQLDSERRGLIEHRWWNVATLQTTRDIIRPAGLGELLPRLMVGDLPQEPVQLPWN
jgi:8-oxo-dGTP pyrophosphatase MutT (NUDIX family)